MFRSSPARADASGARRRHRRATARLAVALVAGCVLVPMPGRAAPTPEPGIQDRRPSDQGALMPQATAEQVRRVQRGLADLGFYDGGAHGRFDAATVAAIAAFQDSLGLAGPPAITDRLIETIDRRSAVDRLLRTVERIRQEDREAARRLIESSPDTRHLAARGPPPSAIARAHGCGPADGAGCLLAEATVVANTIEDARRRDWAFSEILAAQARTGDDAAAERTIGVLGDPRLQLAAMQRLAEIQAERGTVAAALAQAQRLPAPRLRAETLAAITDRVAGRPGGEAAVARLVDSLELVADPVTVSRLHARAAVGVARLGRHEEAERRLGDAEWRARAIPAADMRRSALRHVAMAWTDLQRTERAIALIESDDTEGIVPILVASAGAEARLGRITLALALGDRIAEARYRALALVEIAAGQGAAGDFSGARATIERGLAVAREINLPFARADAIAQLLMTELESAWSGDRAGLGAIEARCAEVNDPARRAAVLWAIAAEWVAIDAEAAARTAEQAREATNRMSGRLQRVWMFSDLAEREMARGRAVGARRAADRARGEAEGIITPWSRARALARLATAVHVVSSGGSGAP